MALKKQSKAMKHVVQTQAYKELKQAPAMALPTMGLLEVGTERCKKPVHRDFAGHCCLLYYSQTRYSGGQHAGRARMFISAQTTEIDRWATKTSGTDQAQRRKRTVAVHLSSTHTKWWGHYDAIHKRLDAHKRHPLSPQPNKNFTSYYLRPRPNHMALKMVRQILTEMGELTNVLPHPSVEKLSLSTLRGQGAGLAYKTGISAGDRKHMGQRSMETMTNIY